MPLELSFGQVEAILAEMNAIASDKRPAFTARLKHLRSLGLPHGARPGRGKPSTFTFGQLMQMVVALEFIQSGVPPALAAKIVGANWYDLRLTIYFATFNETELRATFEGKIEAERLWVLTPEILRDLTEAGAGKFDHYEAVATVGMSDIALHIDQGAVVGSLGEPRRKLILNGTRIARSAIMLAAFHFCFATVEEMRDDLNDEIQGAQKKLDEAIASISDSGGWSKAVDAAIDVMNMRPLFPWSDEEISTAKEIIPRLKESLVSAVLADENEPIILVQDDYDAMVEMGLFHLAPGGNIERTDLGSIVRSILKHLVDAPEVGDIIVLSEVLTPRAIDMVLDRMLERDRATASNEDATDGDR